VKNLKLIDEEVDFTTNDWFVIKQATVHFSAFW